MELDRSVFLTFDIDWAPDEVIDYTYQILKNAGARATFFVTHDTPLLSTLRADPDMELGIHPNFNGFFSGTQTNGRTPGQIIDGLKALVPEAKAYRAHALTHSSILNGIFTPPLSLNCNVFIPGYSEISLLPYRDYCGPVVMPYYFEDDANLLGSHAVYQSPDWYVRRPGLKVFDFHPVHVFLNTASFAQYEEAKPYYQQPEKLIAYRNDAAGAYGAAGFLREVIARARALNYTFCRISDILEMEAERA